MSLFIFGDSHVDIYRYSNIHKYYSNTSIHHTDCENATRTGLFMPYLMNTIANRGDQLLGIYFDKITSGDHVMFIFGEPDCRIHINKQIVQYGRQEDEVIDTLARQYIHMILHITRSTSTHGIVRYVMPPAENEVWSNPTYKPHGSITERVRYTNTLNDKLKELCEEYGLYFFDNSCNNQVTYENGSLKHTYIIGDTHYNSDALPYVNAEIDKFYADFFNGTTLS